MKRLWPAVLILCFTSAAFGHGKSADVSVAVKNGVLHPGDKTEITITVKVADGMHAQSHTPTDPNAIAFEVKAAADDSVQIGTPAYPDAQVKDFPALGTLSVYEGTVAVTVPITVNASAKPGGAKITGTVRLQACTDAVCFGPETTRFEVELAVTAAGQAAVVAPPIAKVEVRPAYAPTTGKTRPVRMYRRDKQTIFGVDFHDPGVPLGLLAALVVGVIFNAMPCVLPVVPLKIVGFYEASHHDRGRSIALGAAFSVGMIASFAVLGYLIVIAHVIDWGGLFQKPWFIAAIVAVLLAMSLSTFGLFTVSVPGKLYAFSPRHDTLFGNGLFGVLTAALSTPCTFGTFVVVLTWLLTQPPVIGLLVMTTVGVGMALPYLILSGFPEVARKFPRAGPWADVVKQFMGFLLLGTAVYFAQPFFAKVHASRFAWWLIFAVVVAAGGFLVIRAVQYGKSSTALVVTSLIAAAMIVPALVYTLRLTTEPFQWATYSDQLMADARRDHRPVVIDFTAAWCGNCIFLEATTLHDAAVFEAVKKTNAVMVRGDVTTDDLPASPLLSELFPSRAIPLTAVFQPDDPVPTLITGIYDAKDFVTVVSENPSVTK